MMTMFIATRTLARRFCLMLVAAALFLSVGVSGASAELTLDHFSAGFLNSDGTPATQAGDHADMQIDFGLTQKLDPERGVMVPTEQVKDLRFELPAGFYGNPQAFPTCDTSTLKESFGVCPVDTQVGVAYVQVGTDLSSPRFGIVKSGVYNVKPDVGQTAAVEFVVWSIPYRIDISVRANGDYGLTSSIGNLSTALPVYGTKITLWGVPSDPVHDAERVTAPFGENPPASSGWPRRPFITLPSRCEPATFAMHGTSWQFPDTWVTATDTTPALENCDAERFDPQLRAQPAEKRPSSPTGFDVDLTVPQDESWSGVGTPPLKKAVVTLPEGVAVSPASADGLAGCSDAQMALGSNEAPSCLDAAKLGTVKIDTPVLADPLEGEVVLGDPKPGELFRLWLVARGPGLVLKVPGIVHPDPETGRLTATFNDTPQLPFSNLHLHFKSGPRAPLTTPRDCGTYTTTAELTAWSGRTANVSDSFTVDGGDCAPHSFEPQVDAGVVDPTAGGSSEFILRVQRDGRESELKSIQTSLPPGLLADVGHVSLCRDAQAASGACPAGSRIGTVVAGAGLGSSPLYVEQGKVFLTEGYRGAPFGLDVLVPAVAGPFDLGDVNVRAALRVDPVTAQATVDADPMPRILEGVPLQVRDLHVAVDRPGFMQSPTSCTQMRVYTTVASYSGEVAKVPSGFKLRDCAALGFSPKLSMSFSGPTHRSAHPALRAVLKTGEDDANIGKAVVTLPKTEFLENAHIRTICTRVQYAADNCPKGSVYGYAKAWSPLLDEPLQGPVYLRSSNHPLPDLVASLDGQIHIDLDGRIDSVHSRMRATFDSVPDAPVSKFVLNMQGGKKGLLVNNTELCQVKPHALAQFTGHNGKHSSSSPLVKTDCGKK